MLASVQPEPKKLSFIVPIGLPGLGKTFFNQNIFQKFMKEQGETVGFETLSNDEVRQELINEYLSANPSASYDAALIETKQTLQSRFEENMIRMIEGFVDEDNQLQTQVVFLDRNYTPQALERH